MIDLLKDVYDFKFRFNHLLIEKIGIINRKNREKEQEAHQTKRKKKSKRSKKKNSKNMKTK